MWVGALPWDPNMHLLVKDVRYSKAQKMLKFTFKVGRDGIMGYEIQK